MMERYSEYKESGVKWLGEIPSHWEVVRFGKHFKFRKGLSITKADLIETGIAVISYGQIHAKNNLGTTLSASLVRYVSQDYLQTHPQCLLTKNDFVFADTSEDIEGSGNFVYNDFKDTIFAGYHTIIAKQNGLYNPKYYAYLFLSESWKNNVRNLVNGVKVYSIGRKQLKDNFLLFPLSHEQDAIVRYLDSATSEIDKAIAMQQKMIDLLNERKQIIIQNAVTKGLDENVEMKESGVEWIGRIPKHWEVKPLKYTGTFDNGLTYSPNEIVEDGVLVIRSSNIQYSKLIFDDNVFVEIAPQSLMVQRGDIIICSRNGSADLVGKCAIVEENINATFGAFMMRYTPNIDNRYAFFLLQTAIGSYKGLFSTSTINQLTKTIIGKMKVPLTEMSEQQQIAAYLDSKMQRFDTAISNCQRQITLLQERKQIIINEVVTGKVRVS